MLINLYNLYLTAVIKSNKKGSDMSWSEKKKKKKD